MTHLESRRRGDVVALLLVVLALTTFHSSVKAINLGDILVTDSGTSSVLVVDPATGSQSVLTTGQYLSDPVAVGVASDLRIYVVEGDRFGVGSKIVRVDAATGVQTVFSSGGSLLDPNDIAFDGTGRLLIADFSGPSGGGGLIRINQFTGGQFDLFSGSPAPFYLAVEASGAVVFTNRSAFGSTLYRFTAGTPAVLSTPVGLAQGVTVEADGNILVADAGTFDDPTPHVFRVDPVSGARTTVSSGGLLGYLAGLALDAAGDIYVSQADAIIRVDPTTGVQSTVSSGGNFSDLQGLTFYGEPEVPQPEYISQIIITGNAITPDVLIFFLHSPQALPCNEFVNCYLTPDQCLVQADCEAADNAAVVAAKLADAINAGCASSGYAAVAEANILTISAPSDFECCFATADMIPSCGLGVSLSNECSVNNVCNGVSCDEIAPHTSGLQFMKIMGPVPAVLQSYSSYWSGTHVEVTWRLTGADGWLDFDVFRREGSSEVFTRLNQNAVRRESHEFVFQDRFVERGKRYIYRVVIREDGEAITSFETTVDAPEVTFRLEQNHPNPFNPTTSIPFSVSRSERVVLAVYDASGRHITTLIDRDMVPGEYSEEWDGRDAHGNAVATGVYMIRLRQGQTALTRKAVLLK